MVEPKAATKLVGATGLVISTMAVASSSQEICGIFASQLKEKKGNLRYVCWVAQSGYYQCSGAQGDVEGV
ncbi:hypothetical protein Tco_0256940 [Tanacetum coccineum]